MWISSVHPHPKKKLGDVSDEHCKRFHGAMLSRVTVNNYPDWILLASHKRRSRDIQEAML
jgi:hypothetical protein